MLESWDLAEIDAELIIADDVEQTLSLPDEEVMAFNDWLMSAEVVTDETEPLSVFVQAEKVAGDLSSKIAAIDVSGFATVSNMLASFESLIGSCGPLCAHVALNSLSNMGQGAGMTWDSSHGHYHPRTEIAQLFDLPEAVRQNVQRILRFMQLDESWMVLMGFGAVTKVMDMFFDGFLPRPVVS